MNIKDLLALEAAFCDAREEMGLPPPVLPEKHNLWIGVLNDKENYWPIYEGIFTTKEKAIKAVADVCREMHKENEEEIIELPKDDLQAIERFTSNNYWYAYGIIECSLNNYKP